MNMRDDGSALVMLLLILSTAIICSFALWRHSLRIADVVYNKELYYQQRYATEGLLLCGCRIAAYNSTKLMQEFGRQAVITFSQWPITVKTTGRGLVYLTAQTPEQIEVRAFLYRDEQCVCSLACTVHVTKEGDRDTRFSHPSISSWTTLSL